MRFDINNITEAGIKKYFEFWGYDSVDEKLLDGLDDSVHELLSRYCKDTEKPGFRIDGGVLTELSPTQLYYDLDSLDDSYL